MSESSRYAIVVGLLITAATLLAQWLGLFETLERDSIDLRSKYAWRAPRPMSAEICHVDIDDGAIVSVGRWPWDRSKLADAIVELRRAGAKTVALDLMFSEAQRPEWLEVRREELPQYQVGQIESFCPQENIDGNCFVLIDHDAAFASALHVGGRDVPAQCVLSVKPSDQLEQHEQWQTPRGADEYQKLMDVLSANILLTDDEAMQKAGLVGARQALFRRRPNLFKELAAWGRLVELDHQAVAGGRALTFDEFLMAMTPTASATLGDFPERRILDQVWQQRQSWKALRPHLLIGSASSAAKDEAPLPKFAQQAASVGFVNRQEDADGAVRSLRPIWPAPGGLAVQLGVAAACHHLGLPVSSIEVHPDRIRVGSRSLVLRDDRLWISWPRPLNRLGGAFGAIRQEEGDPENFGHTSIATFANLAAQRRIQDRIKQQFANLTYEFATGRKDKPPTYENLTPRMLEDAAGFVEMGLPEAGDPADDAGTAHLRAWLALRESIANGQPRLDEVEREVVKRVKGKLVFIGATFTGAAADFVPTPLGALTPGVIVHAAVADMVLNGRSLRFAPPWSTYALALFLGLGATIAASTLTPVKSTIFATFLVVGYALLACFGLFAALDLVVAMTAPAMAGAGAWVACTVVEAALFQRDRLRITRQFKARVSGQLVDFLVDNPNSVALSGEQREMTIMFTDLAGFTSISESLGGQATVATLNRYMGAMTKLLIAEGAYLNKFLGDGFMAFWSAFALDKDQATRACRAALHCQDAITRLNQDTEFGQIPKLSLRVGITTGRVIVGDCGAPPDLNDYTVIGDAVNLAARLESANKQFGTRILIDGRTRELLGSGGILLRPIGRVVALGQTVPIETFEVMAPQTPAEMIDLTARAVQTFQGGDLATSAALWKQLDERFGHNKLAEIYLQAIAEAGEDFNGVIRLQVK